MDSMPEEPRVHGECVSLLEYIKELRKADQEQIKVARESMEERLKSVNEFRSQLKDQAGTFVTRTEMDAKHNALEARLRGVEKLVWMGMGAIAVIQLILHFIK
jgi:hypothetical protein